MYNIDIKERFIDYYSNFNIIHPYRLKTLFESSEIFEESLGKDIGNFTKNELKEFYVFKDAKSINTLQVTNSLLKSYINWFIEQGMSTDNQNHTDEIKLYDIEGCINKKVLAEKYITYDELTEYQKELDNPIDKFILQALFEGIKGKSFDELLSLSIVDFDRVNCTVKLKGRELNVSSKLINLAEDTVDTYEYYPLLGGKPYQLFGEDLFKNKKRQIIETTSRRAERLAAKFRLLQKYFDNNLLSAIRVHDAGIIYSMKQVMNETGMDIDELLSSREMEEIKIRYNINMPKYQIKSKFKNYL